MIFNSTKFGHDISTWQDSPSISGTVDFDRMVANGASFVVFRATVGDLLDADFQTYKNNSRGKLPRAVYHYYWNSVSPAIQAELCLSAIGAEKFEGRVWLDLENTTAGAYNKPHHWREFCQIIEARGIKTGIYTGYYFWQTYAVETGVDLSYFYARPLWQAWYNANPANVLIAGNWLNMMIWQDTSTGGGYAAGVESINIDHNQWNDEYSFENEWGAVTPPPTGDAMKGKMLNYAVNVRNRTSGAIVATLAVNDVVYGPLVLEGTREYIHFEKIYRANGTVQNWANSKAVTDNGAGVDYMLVTNEAEPVPPPEPAGDISIDMTLKADGTIVGTWKNI